MNTYLHTQGLRRWLLLPRIDRPKGIPQSSFSEFDQPTHRHLQLSRIDSVGIVGPVRHARDRRRFSPPFWSTLSATNPLFRLGPLMCLWAPIGSARAGRAPGFNSIVPAKP